MATSLNRSITENRACRHAVILNISKDVTRVTNRFKALYRSWGIACAGTKVYARRHRSEWLGRISEAGVRRRAKHCYEQLDILRPLRQQVRRDLLLESKKHQAWRLLGLIPGIGPIRASLLIALIQTPHRFRTKRHLWTYSGLGPTLLNRVVRSPIPRKECLAVSASRPRCRQPDPKVCPVEVFVESLDPSNPR